MKYAIDRIIEDIVVLENISTGEIIEKNIKELPKGIHEGSIILSKDNEFIIDENEELLRKKSLRERLERLKNLKKWFMEKLYKITGEDIYDRELTDICVEGYYDYFEIDHSIIKKCDFSKSNLQGIDISDTEVISSNFSNVDLSSRSYKNMKFVDSTLVGVDFNSSFLENVTFINCNLSYSNFSGCNIRNVKFENCKLDDASFNSLKWKSLLFDNCTMKSVEFFQTKLKDIDLSNCQISDLRVPIDSLKGLVVSYEQAIGLSLLLGIKIK